MEFRSEKQVTLPPFSTLEITNKTLSANVKSRNYPKEKVDQRSQFDGISMKIKGNIDNITTFNFPTEAKPLTSHNVSLPSLSNFIPSKDEENRQNYLVEKQQVLSMDSSHTLISQNSFQYLQLPTPSVTASPNQTSPSHEKMASSCSISYTDPPAISRGKQSVQSSLVHHSTSSLPNSSWLLHEMNESADTKAISPNTVEFHEPRQRHYHFAKFSPSENLNTIHCFPRPRSSSSLTATIPRLNEDLFSQTCIEREQQHPHQQKKFLDSKDDHEDVKIEHRRLSLENKIPSSNISNASSSVHQRSEEFYNGPPPNHINNQNSKKMEKMDHDRYDRYFNRTNSYSSCIPTPFPPVSSSTTALKACDQPFVSTYNQESERRFVSYPSDMSTISTQNKTNVSHNDTMGYQESTRRFGYNTSPALLPYVSRQEGQVLPSETTYNPFYLEQAPLYSHYYQQSYPENIYDYNDQNVTSKNYLQMQRQVPDSDSHSSTTANLALQQLVSKHHQQQQQHYNCHQYYRHHNYPSNPSSKNIRAYDYFSCPTLSVQQNEGDTSLYLNTYPSSLQQNERYKKFVDRSSYPQGYLQRKYSDLSTSTDHHRYEYQKSHLNANSARLLKENGMSTLYPTHSPQDSVEKGRYKSTATTQNRPLMPKDTYCLKQDVHEKDYNQEASLKITIKRCLLTNQDQERNRKNTEGDSFKKMKFDDPGLVESNSVKSHPSSSVDVSVAVSTLLPTHPCKPSNICDTTETTTQPVTVTTAKSTLHNTQDQKQRKQNRSVIKRNKGAKATKRSETPFSKTISKTTSTGNKNQVRSFLCEYCHLTFRRCHDLRRHEKIHLQIRPYECKECGKSFIRKDTLYKHQRSKSHRYNVLKTTCTYPSSSPSSSSALVSESSTPQDSKSSD